jgi:hypothetical protein
MLAAAAGVVASLLWDFSWESTVGIDRFWGPPHTLTYVSMALAGIAAVVLAIRARAASASDNAVRIGLFRAPLGAWLVLWGALAFVTAVVFDGWWQSAYGLGAGIWHPPQLLKATAFFAVVIGAWLLGLVLQNQRAHVPGAFLFSIAGGLVLALITVVTLPAHYPNHQHSASFYKLACATYPFVLVALARAGRLRWAAAAGALFYMAIFCAAVWVLPLVPGQPQVGPIYNPMDHLMPPPFPLLLIVPALAMDWILKKIRWPARRGVDWRQACWVGVAFFLLFLLTQFIFAAFLLKNSADNWFFAGGGRHWPFFLKINPAGRVAFWTGTTDALDGANALLALCFSVMSARLGLWVGAWMERVRR